MAWRWWKRRRRGWFRRRWTRGRIRRRWARRPYSRPRRRTVRRRRRRRRGRRKFRRYRVKRRYRRRKKTQKIKLTQWQPAKIKRCFMIGYFPIVIQGQGRWSENFTSHIEDKVAKGPFGGGHSTSRWSLKVLYEENQKYHNFWTASNNDLELARFFGSCWRFYRHDTQDYIVTWNRRAPLGGNILTAPNMHPGIAMLSKHKVVVPSKLTRPKGKKSIKVNIKPPTTFIDKWYFQKDICDLTLLNLNVVTCDLRFPFCSPQTDNICVTFQVLAPIYNEYMSITSPNLTSTSWENYYTQFLQKAIPENKDRKANILNTFLTEGSYRKPQVEKYRKPLGDNEYYSPKDAQWGDAIHIITQSETTGNQKKQDREELITKIVANAKNVLTKINQELQAYEARQTEHAIFTHWTGIFGPPFLDYNRISPEIKGLYKDVIYNPLIDKGVGNHIWVDYCSKGNNEYSETQSKCHLTDLPLWCITFGYADWVKKDTGNWGIVDWARVLIICPYTYPKLYDPDKPNRGFVVYSSNFAMGRMPDGSKYVPIGMRHKWYPTMLNQQPVLEDISLSGPFAPREKVPSVQLTAKYKFRWHFGGNPVSEQVIKDPCQQPTFQMPGTGTLPRRIQVADPKYLGPQYTFHSWDYRRDFFNRKTIKRMSEQPETFESIFSGPKKPRVDLDKIQLQEDNYSQGQRKQKPWEDSETQTESEVPSEEETQNLQQQLQQQLREQKQLRQGINCLFEQLIKTQQGVHIDPSLV
uniref:Capsid protein n=1 Tax=Alphatorquevirus homin9 TaxID=3048433 RepID=A0AAU7SSD9_9VIRU